MEITLNHTIVPAHDKEASASFFANIFGLEYSGVKGHFAPVRINDNLTLDFDNRDEFDWHHYAFKVGETEFDEVFEPRERGRTTLRERPRFTNGRSTECSPWRPRILFRRSERAHSGAYDAD